MVNVAEDRAEGALPRISALAAFIQATSRAASMIAETPSGSRERVDLEPPDMDVVAGRPPLCPRTSRIIEGSPTTTAALRQALRHVGDHRRRADAAQLLVVAERDLERAFGPLGQRPSARRQRASASNPFMSQVPRP